MCLALNLSVLYLLADLMLTVIWGGYYYQPQFIGMKLKPKEKELAGFASW